MHPATLFSISSLQPYAFAILLLLIAFAIGWFIGINQAREWAEDKLVRSRNFQRGVLKGTISEQLAPYLPNFPEDLKASEARFLGKPVDFIVFKGLDDNNITEVVFVEVKSGRQNFNQNELSLKYAIEQKRVRYIPYQTPKLSVNYAQEQADSRSSK